MVRLFPSWFQLGIYATHAQALNRLLDSFEFFSILDPTVVTSQNLWKISIRPFFSLLDYSLRPLKHRASTKAWSSSLDFQLGNPWNILPHRAFETFSRIEPIVVPQLRAIIPYLSPILWNSVYESPRLTLRRNSSLELTLSSWKPFIDLDLLGHYFVLSDNSTHNCTVKDQVQLPPRIKLKISI